MRTSRLFCGPIFLCSALLLAACDDDHDHDGDDNVTTTTTTTTSTIGEPVTTTTTTSTTTVSTPPTTSPNGGNAFCNITWSVTNDVTLGALQFNTDYNAIRGDLEGAGDQVECSDLTGSLATFNDDDAANVLSAGFISLGGIDAPLAVMQCQILLDYSVGPVPQPGDCVVTVVDATDPALTPVTADVAVTKVDCSPIGTTTTTSTLITVPSTAPPSNTFTLGFELDDAVNVGALQLAVDYSQAAGDFDGDGDAVECTDRTGSLASFNDDDGTSTLAAGFINLGGFTGPRLLAECTFTSTGDAPVPADFAVSVVDAATPDLTPIVPLPAISVTVTPQ